MYEGYTRLIIVYLTHLLLVQSYFPSRNIAFAWGRGLVQALIVMAMHAPSEYSKAISTIFSWLYTGTLALWVGVQLAIILKKHGGL
jgi:hypothetical protein